MKKLRKDLNKRLNFKNYEKEIKIYKALINNELLPLEVRLNIQDIMLKTIPKSARRTQQRNLCLETGRARGILSSYGLSRIEIKEKGELGEITG
jgi:small subunit ribosomal protein S14